jgi:hypothetical protein
MVDHTTQRKQVQNIRHSYSKQHFPTAVTPTHTSYTHTSYTHLHVRFEYQHIAKMIVSTKEIEWPSTFQNCRSEHKETNEQRCATAVKEC